MAYDFGGSFDTFDPGGGAPVPDAAASAAADAGAATASTVLAMDAAAAAAMSSVTTSLGASGDADDGWRGDAGPGANAFVPTRPAFDHDDDDGDWNGDGGRRAARRRGGLFGAIRRFFGMTSADEERVAELRAAVRRARQLHPDVGHQCTAEVAAQFGRAELEGAGANAQVATMRARWRTVDAEAAADLAERGRLVVAGLEGEGNGGHTAVVVPGPGATHDGRFYPNVAGGGLPFRRSDGSRSAAEVWTSAERARVRYFTPR